MKREGIKMTLNFHPILLDSISIFLDKLEKDSEEKELLKKEIIEIMKSWEV